MEDYRQSIATQLIDEHVRQHRQLKLSDQSDVVSFMKEIRSILESIHRFRNTSYTILF